MSDISNSSPDTTEYYEGYFIEAENAAEMARQMLHDHLLTRAMGGPLPEPIDSSQIYQVLDIACGSGGWILDLMAQYPHMRGVGIDISQLMIEYATSLVKSQGLSQAQFQVMDATKPLHFPDNTFDLVNGRLLTGFLSTQQWSALLSECHRINKQGGILRLTEAEWAFTNSAALDKLAGFCYIGLSRAGHSFSPHGRTFGTSNVLRLLLRRTGYERISYQAHALDYSAGTDAHQSSCQNLLVFHKLIQPFLVQMHIASQEELDSLYKQMEEEIQTETFCAIDYFLTVWGRKAG
ncbi:MAG: methyltransferase domain-containing protein [Chloroflexi bacterium]|nr:methyltransferase domain-containing protein [Chloroflexota bacterium]